MHLSVGKAGSHYNLCGCTFRFWLLTFHFPTRVVLIINVLFDAKVLIALITNVAAYVCSSLSRALSLYITANILAALTIANILIQSQLVLGEEKSVI